jgi:glutaminyl-tRNA synthetase
LFKTTSADKTIDATMETQHLPERAKAPKAKKEKPPKQPKGPTPPKPKRPPAPKAVPEDPESMFKVGFLADVYQERPKGYEGREKIITRVRSTPRQEYEMLL